MHALKDVAHRTRKDGTIVLLSDVHRPLVALQGSSVLAEIGEDRVFGNLDDALNYACRHLGLPEAPAPPNVQGSTTRERERSTIGV